MFTTLSLDISRLWAVGVSTDPAASNSTLEEWKASLDNALGSGVMDQSLAQSGAGGAVSRPGKFSSEGCLPGGGALGAGGGGAAPGPGGQQQQCSGGGGGGCRYQHKHVIAAAVVGSCGGVILGAAMFGVGFCLTRPKEQQAAKRTEENRYGGGQISTPMGLPEGKA